MHRTAVIMADMRKYALTLLLICGLLLFPGASAQDAVMDKQEDNKLDDIDIGKAAAEVSLGDVQKPKGFFGKLFHKVNFWRLEYYFVAQNAANCDLFYGSVKQNPLIGRASLSFTFPNGCNCHGVAQVTHNPGSVVGQRGYMKAKCSDGRVMKGKFSTTSLTSGSGTATDNRGNSYEFTFGHTAVQAVESVNLLRKKLGCPECDAKDIELKVQGLILKK